jgi:hypothetical protein
MIRDSDKERQVEESLLVPRNIFFCKLDLGMNTHNNEPVLCNFEAVLNEISELKFDRTLSLSRYVDIGDEPKNYALWIDDPINGYPTARFALVRNDQHPAIDVNGEVQCLSDSVEGNPLDYIHIVFFDDNVIGYELNQFGPKISKLSYYINKTVSGFSLAPITHCLKRSVFEQLAQINRPTLVKARIRKESFNADSSRDPITQRLRSFVSELDGYEVQVQIKMSKKSSNESNRATLSEFTSGLLRNTNKKSVKELRIHGWDQDNTLLKLNFKEARLRYGSHLRKQGSRDANVLSEDAYRTIVEVYNANTDEILDAYH